MNMRGGYRNGTSLTGILVISDQVLLEVATSNFACLMSYSVRGILLKKGKGDMKMYFVVNEREAYSNLHNNDLIKLLLQV